MNRMGRIVLAAALLALGSTACYRGGARPVEMSSIINDPNWVALNRVPKLTQDGEHECGATAVAMVLDYWGQQTEPEEIRKASKESSDHGLPAGFLRTYLRGRGLQAYLVQGSFDDIEHELKNGRPVLVGVARQFSTGVYAHYQVVIGINRGSKQLAVIDPADGWREYSFEDFSREWLPAKSLTLVVSPPAVASQDR